MTNPNGGNGCYLCGNTRFQLLLYGANRVSCRVVARAVRSGAFIGTSAGPASCDRSR